VRIVAGVHRGRKLAALPGTAIRPTGGRARAAAFNILEHARFNPRPACEDAVALDAFAGTGAMGLEALSRGARYCTFLERGRAARAILEQNIAALGEKGRSAVLGADALKPPRAAAPASLAFLDPPYAEDVAAPALAALAAAGWLLPGAIAVIEIPAKRGLIAPDGFGIIDQRRYGAAKLVFLRYRG